jgi:cytochrome P450
MKHFVVLKDYKMKLSQMLWWWVLCRGAQWTGMRNILLPLFHSEQLHTLTPILTRIINTFTTNLSRREPTEDVNISDLFHLYGLDVIGESAFGTRFNLLHEDSGRISSPKGDKSGFSISNLFPFHYNHHFSFTNVIIILAKFGALCKQLKW